MSGELHIMQWTSFKNWAKGRGEKSSCNFCFRMALSYSVSQIFRKPKSQLCSHFLLKQHQKNNLIFMLPVSWRCVIPLRPHTWTPVNLGSLEANTLICYPVVSSKILLRKLPNFEHVQVWLEYCLWGFVGLNMSCIHVRHVKSLK